MWVGQADGGCVSAAPGRLRDTEARGCRPSAQGEGGVDAAPGHGDTGARPRGGGVGRPTFQGVCLCVSAWHVHACTHMHMRVRQLVCTCVRPCACACARTCMYVRARTRERAPVAGSAGDTCRDPAVANVRRGRRTGKGREPARALRSRSDPRGPQGPRAVRGEALPGLGAVTRRAGEAARRPLGDPARLGPASTAFPGGDWPRRPSHCHGSTRGPPFTPSCPPSPTAIG